MTEVIEISEEVKKKRKSYSWFIILMTLLISLNLLLLVVGIWGIANGGIPYSTNSGGINLSLTETNKGRPKKGELIFNEEFNRLNLDTWEHEITMTGGGNGEFQIYHNNRSNSYVKFGKLFIKPTLTVDQFGDDVLNFGKVQLGGGATADQCTSDLLNGCYREGSITNPLPPIMSARLRTLKSFSFKYGRIEVKAKMPEGDWLWPAIWLMPEKNQYGGWPASGEIDLVESRGNLKLEKQGSENSIRSKSENIGVNKAGSTLHFGPFWPENGYEHAHFTKSSNAEKGFSSKFYTYQMEWTPEYIRFSIDDEAVGTVNPGEGGFWELGQFPSYLSNPWQYGENSIMAPFDQRFYLILNVAVGGTNGYFPDNLKTSKPWKNNSPHPMKDFWEARADWLPTWDSENAAMQIDHIRVWAL